MVVPRSNPRPRYVKRQLVSLPRVGIFKNVYVQFFMLLSLSYGVPNWHFRAKINRHLNIVIYLLFILLLIFFL